MAFTDEQKAEIAGLLTEALGSALTPIKDEFTKMVSGAIAKSHKALEGKIPQAPTAESLAALVKEQLEAAQASKLAETDQAKGGAVQPAKPDPALLKLQEELENIKKDRERIARESKEEKDRHARDEEENALAQALGPHVRQSAAMVEAAKLLLLKRNVVQRNDKGEIVYKATRKSGSTEYEELLPLNDGVKEWAASKEAEDFLPPKDAGGSGDARRGQRGAGMGGGDLEVKRANFFGHLKS